MRAFAAVRDSLRTVMIDVPESIGPDESGLGRRQELPIGEAADARRRPLGDRQQTGTGLVPGRVSFWQ